MCDLGQSQSSLNLMFLQKLNAILVTLQSGQYHYMSFKLYVHVCLYKGSIVIPAALVFYILHPNN